MVERLVMSLATCVLTLLLAPGAGAAGSFHRVGFLDPSVYRVESDGVRYADTFSGGGSFRVFDTVRGRRFRPQPPAPGCFGSRPGGGLMLWFCIGARAPLITDLATGAVRDPVGWDAVRAMDTQFSTCAANAIGLHWLEFSCGSAGGPPPDPVYLNHHTGAIRQWPNPPAYVDLNYRDLVRPVCDMLGRDRRYPNFDGYEAPFALKLSRSEAGWVSRIDLRRCGRTGARVLSRCRYQQCIDPQLGSGFVTWGDNQRVVAYVPRTGKRVVLHAPAAASFDFLPIAVAHTCNRVFAQWGSYLYTANVKRGWGTRPCPAR
jgi:hypothetical protein